MATSFLHGRAVRLERRPVERLRAWWRGTDLLVAVYRGEADAFAGPEFPSSRFFRADLYEGLPEHVFRFD